MSAPVEPSVAPLEAAAARVEADGRVLAEALTLRLRGPRVVLVGDASAVLGPLLHRAQVTRGIFRVFNQDVSLANVPVALVPRDPPLPPDLTPLAFVTWSVRLGRGLSRRKAADVAAEACERVGLGVEARARLVRSAPLTRRLTLLAHAAALAPRMVVLEEPLEGLGPDDVGSLLRAIDRAVGSACALVSTPRADAASPGHALARGANEVVLLEGGRVLGQGRPEDVFTAFAVRSGPAPSLAPAPGFGPVSGLTPAPGFAPVSSLTPAPGLLPAPSVGPVSSLTPAPSVGPVSSLAPVTTFGPASSLAPASDAAPVSSFLPASDVAPVSSFSPASDAAPVTSLAPATSVGSPPSQRMTRLAPEPTKAPTTPEPPPASQRTTRLPDSEVLRLSALASAALNPNAEAAPLTRRAPGVEPAFARAILADLELPTAPKAPSVPPTALKAPSVPPAAPIATPPVSTASTTPTAASAPVAPTASEASAAPTAATAPVDPAAPPTLAPPALVAPDAAPPSAASAAPSVPAVPAAAVVSERHEAEVLPPPPSPSAPARTSEASRPGDGQPDPEKRDALGRPALARRSRYAQGGRARGSGLLRNPHCPASDS